MSDGIALLIQVGLAGIGLWYVVSVLRRRRAANVSPASSAHTPKIAPSGRANPSTSRDPRVLASWWESIRTWATKIAIGLFILMAILLALAAPVSMIQFVLIGIGVSMAVYLVASAASGWYEGKSQL